MGDPPRPRIGEVIETSLYVDDLDRAFAFYQDVLGLEPATEAQDRIRALKVTADQVLLLFARGATASPVETDYGTIPPHDGAGTDHLAFGIPAKDFEAWRAYLQSHGVAIESTFEWPMGGRSLFFRDPDDHLLELKTSNWFGAELVW